jgi:glycosyltransferase involved in cell wall biosynthesis
VIPWPEQREDLSRSGFTNKAFGPALLTNGSEEVVTMEEGSLQQLVLSRESSEALDDRDPIPLKVCMLAACPFPANHGTPGSIREMAEAVVERGHEVYVVTYHFGEDIPLHGPQIHRIPPLTREKTVVVGPTSRKPLYDLQMVFKTLEVIRQFRCDILQAHGYEAALVAGLCKLATGLPVVYNGHNTMLDELPTYNFIRPRALAEWLGKLLDGFVPRIADRCMPHSANMEEFFRHMGLGSRTEPVLKIGINLDVPLRGDPAEVRRRYGLNDGPVILYAGVMDEFQRLDLLLEGLATVCRHLPRAKLLMVVTVPNAKQIAGVQRRAEELGVAANLVFSEPQTLDSVPLFLRSCDVAIVPRPQTPGFPMKMINYMAAQRPAVLFASSAFSGLVHRENCFLAEPDTGEALGRAILEVLGDKPLQQRLTANGFRFVREHHDRRLTAQQICATFYRTLAMTQRLHLLARRAKAAPWSNDSLLPVQVKSSGEEGSVYRNGASANGRERQLTEVLCNAGN